MKTLIVAIARQLERSRTRQKLERLSDRELRDIGLARTDISFVVHNGRRPQDLLA